MKKIRNPTFDWDGTARPPSSDEYGKIPIQQLKNYVVNEIENINFGENVNQSVNTLKPMDYLGVDQNYSSVNQKVSRIDKYNEYVNKSSDDSLHLLLSEHLPNIFTDWSTWDARKILLSFE